MAIPAFSTYPGRLQTFEGYWNDHEATAQQLAAIGHVYDRPPLEVFEEGSRCVSCSAFVKKHLSVRAFEGNEGGGKYEDVFESFDFHHPSCTRLSVRIPLDPQAVIPGLHGNRMNDLKRRFETAPSIKLPRIPQRVSQKSSFFSLPTEIRLEIYALILPSLDLITDILQLNQQSARVITYQGYHRTGPRNLTKLNILRTCRALQDEAMDMIYSNTVFRFESTKVMYLFLRSIGAAGRRLVKSVDIRCGYREDATAFALLAVCNRLQSICIRLARPMLFLPRAPIWSFDGMTCLLALSGLEEVTFAGDASPPPPNHLSDKTPDAAVVRKQLTRPRGTGLDMAIFESFTVSEYLRVPEVLHLRG